MANLAFLYLKVPKSNPQGPLSAESIYSGLSELFRNKPVNVSLEIVLRDRFLHFFFVCNRENVDIIKGQFFSQYQNLEVSEVNDYTLGASGSGVVAQLKTSAPDFYPLKTYKELDTDFLTNLSGLAASSGKDDFVVIQIIFQPVNKDMASYRLGKFIKNYLRETLVGKSKLEEFSRKKEEKLKKTIFNSCIRVAAFGPKAESLVSTFVSLFRSLDNPNFNSLRLWKKSDGGQLLLDFRERNLNGKKFILTTDELATIFHLPHAEAGVSQVATSRGKTSEPPPNLPIPPDTVPFAATNFRGNQTQFGIRREDRRRHLYTIGKTGVGKTKLIELLALNDLREGKGCVIMDPHGDMAEELLRYIPRERLYDVVYFNPSDLEHPISFNPMEGTGSFEFKQNVVSGFIAIFKKLFSFTWNQRLEHVLRYTTLALLDVPNSTVLGITRMLSDNKYRQEVIAQIKDPLVKKFWTTEFSSWNDQFAGEAITPIINKVGQFVASPIIRNIVGQPRSSMNIEEIINKEMILIANFSIGKLGEENSALLGAMFITKLWQAAVGRASLPEEDRRDTFLYVDEFQNFATSAFANILSEARKYRLNLTVAHQYMSQLPEEVRSTIFGNVGSIISFRTGGEDAQMLEKEYKPTFLSEDFMNLDVRNFYIKMTIGGQVATPFSGKTLDFPKPDEDLASDIIRISRERWSRSREEVEREVARQEETVATEPDTAGEAKFNEPLL